MYRRQRKIEIAQHACADGRGYEEEFPEIVESARLLQLFSDGKTLLQTNNSNGTERKSFYQEKAIWPMHLFKMFDYDFIEGNANATLQNPNTIVLNEAIAKKLLVTSLH